MMLLPLLEGGIMFAPGQRSDTNLPTTSDLATTQHSLLAVPQVLRGGEPAGVSEFFT